ncbi:MAG TPA: hypothetical protein VEJ67_16940 [Candidatus Cybelea sp.]|nr:hypothetical protein [Candidatus Cybelea sp.]
MNDIIDFIQNYWFELASLTAQFSILAVLTWYARARLRMAARSEPEARRAARPAVAVAFPTPMDSELAEDEAFTGLESRGPQLAAYPSSPVSQSRGGPLRGLIDWLQAPVSIREAKRRHASGPATESQAPGHGGVGRMLSPLPQAPLDESEAVIEPSPERAGLLRGMIRWLRAPMYTRTAPRQVTRQI